MSSLKRFTAVAFVWILSYSSAINANESGNRAPTATEFRSMLTTCAAGHDLDLKADLVGSIVELYEGERTEGSSRLRDTGAFLDALPKEDRLAAYELYLTCIEQIINRTSSESPSQSPSVSVQVGDGAQVEGNVQAAFGDIVNQYDFDEADRINALRIVTEVGIDCRRYLRKIEGLEVTSDPGLLTVSDFLYGIHYHHTSALFGEKLYRTLIDGMESITESSTLIFSSLLQTKMAKTSIAGYKSPESEKMIIEAHSKFAEQKPRLLRDVVAHCDLLDSLKTRFASAN